jgi:pyruvate kinase
MSESQNAEQPSLTKIVATIGPASSSPEIVHRLIDAGVAVVRLNFSHGTIDDHVARVRTIRDVSGDLGKPVAIMGDLQGPKIRVGRVAGDGIVVAPGQTVIFARGEFEAQQPILGAGESPRFSCTYPRLVDEVAPGQRLLVNDGAIRMLIIARRADHIECTVNSSGDGVISSGKGINLPETNLSLPALSERDAAHAKWSLENDLDFLALSFVRTADDVKSLRELIATIRRPSLTAESRQPTALSIIAKIETPAAVENIDGILEAADGLMVARGDLGVEMDLARVPIIQKQLLAAADSWGKPAIVATQMLESMISNPSPTRAEVSDVANAILDGADAVMLSGETAVGKHPVLAVENMRRIALCTEQFIASQPPTPSPPARLVASRYRTAALAHGVWTIAQDIAAKFIAVWSQGGGGARYLSQNNFTIPIFAITSDPPAARRMQLFRGVIPLVMPVPENLAHFTRMADAYLMETGWATMGDTCIHIAGGPIGVSGVTNSLAIHRVGDPRTGFESLIAPR